MTIDLLKAFGRGIKNEQKGNIQDWARENVKLAQSKKSNVADISLTPWISDVLQTVLDGDYEDIIFAACTGAGKSTLIEILSLYIILEKSGPAGLFMQSGTTAQAFMETRLKPAIMANPRAVALLPHNKHKIKRDSILFDHMALWCRGSSIGNLQSLSLDAVILDECFMLPSGTIDYAKKRNHDRPFSWMLLTSQPGKTSSDFHRWHKSAKQMDYHGFCPECEQLHAWDFRNLNFEELGNVFYCCPCGAQHADKVQVRRQMSAKGAYVHRETENTDPRRIAFNFSAGLKWERTWESIAREFIAANEEKKRGNFEPLEKFRNQTLAEWWDDGEIDFASIAKAGYSLDERTQYAKTFLTVDVQGAIGDNSFWFKVRTFKESGESRLLDFGRFGSYSDIAAKQKEWNLPPTHVAIDGAYKSEDVRNFAARHGYMVLNGVKSTSFPVLVKGKTVNRLFGMIRKEKTLSGKLCYYAPYASNAIKTLCAGFRSSGLWKIAADIPDYYLKQLSAERFEDGAWKERHKGSDNHAIDLDAMQCVLAMIHKIQMTTSTEYESGIIDDSSSVG